MTKTVSTLQGPSRVWKTVQKQTMIRRQRNAAIEVCTVCYFLIIDLTWGKDGRPPRLVLSRLNLEEEKGGKGIPGRVQQKQNQEVRKAMG